MKIIQEVPSQLTLESKVIFGLLGSTTYTFDKASGALKISGKGMFGAKPQEFPLAGITGVALQEQSRTGAERNDPSARTFRIELLKRDGSRMPLTLAYTSGKKSKEDLVEKIRAFLFSGV